MPEMSAAQIIQAFDKAKADKTVVESTAEDLLYYAAPRKRGMQSQYTPGEKPPEDIYDDTAIQSNLIRDASFGPIG